MPRKTQWTETLDVNSVMTPIHARNEEQHPMPQDPSALRRNKLFLMAFGIALCFCSVLVVFAYQNSYFVPVVVIGSIGTFCLTLIILNDIL